MDRLKTSSVELNLSLELSSSLMTTESRLFEESVSKTAPTGSEWEMRQKRYWYFPGEARHDLCFLLGESMHGLWSFPYESHVSFYYIHSEPKNTSLSWSILR